MVEVADKGASATILCVNRPNTDELADHGSNDLAAMLDRHGLKTKIVHRDKGPDGIAEVLMHEAFESGADMNCDRRIRPFARLRFRDRSSHPRSAAQCRAAGSVFEIAARPGTDGDVRPYWQMIRGASRQWAIFDTACAKLQPISDRNPVKRGQRLRSMVSPTWRVNVEPFSYWFQPNAWRPFIKVTHDHRVIRRTKPIRYGSQLLATMIPGQPQMGANNHQRGQLC